MKKLLIFTFIGIINSALTFAQSVEWGSDLVDCMYAGYNNVLPLKFVDVEEADVKVEVSNGDLSKNTNGKYVWTGVLAGNFETVTCMYNNKVIGEFRMKFVRFPDPVVQVSPNNASPKTIKAVNCVAPPNVKSKLSAHTQSFDIRISIGDEIRLLHNKGSNLTAENKKALKYLQNTAQVEIINVKARCPGDKAARTLGTTITLR